MISLPKEKDCTVSTIAHQWRSWSYFEEEYRSCHLPVNFNKGQMLNMSLIDLAKGFTKKKTVEFPSASLTVVKDR